MMNNNNTPGVPVAKDLQSVDGTIEIENVSVVIESPIKDEGVGKFNATVKFSPPVILLPEASIKILEALTKAVKSLPKSETPDSIVSRVRPVLVPYWEQSGYVSGSWKATGIKNRHNKIQCPKCRGKGHTGTNKTKKICINCFGSGTKKSPNQKSDKTSESGDVEARVKKEFIENFNSEINFQLSPTSELFSRALTDTELVNFTCIPPKSFNCEQQGDALIARLDNLLRSNVSKCLRAYDRIEGQSITKDKSNIQFELNAFLYPAYVCWYKKGSKLKYVVCDGITGEVRLPSRVGSILWKFIKISFGIIVGLMIIGLFAGKGDDKKQAIQNVVVPEILDKPIAAKTDTQPKITPLAVSKNNDLILAVNKLRDVTHAVANAHDDRLSRHSNDQTTQFSLGSETIRFEQRRDEKCGVIPKVLLDANDDDLRENFSNDLLKTIQCHIDENTKRLKDIN